jgi:hypothetical protein
MGDPTTAFLESFSDPSRWDRVVRAVPIFKPHETTGTGPDGKPKTIKVDKARLGRIADKIKALYEKHGVAIKFLIGHTKPRDKDGKPVRQEDQPRVVAYGINPRVGPWGPQGEPGILTDVFVCKGELAALQEGGYPGRSAEFYDESDEITAVSLLKTDPRLDLGMVDWRQAGECTYYARQAGRVLVYSEFSPMFDDDDKGKPDGAGDGKKADPAASPDSKDPDQEFMEKCDRYMAARYPQLAQMYGGAAMGPTNGAPPMGGPPMGGPPPGPPPAPAAPGLPPPEAQRMQRDSEAIRYQRIEAELTQLRYERDAAVCERSLQQLEAEGYELDRAREVKTMVPMQPADREAHLTWLRQYMRQAPVQQYGSMNGLIRTADQPKQDQAAAAKHERVLARVRANPGLQYEEAERQLDAGK